MVSGNILSIPDFYRFILPNATAGSKYGKDYLVYDYISFI